LQYENAQQPTEILIDSLGGSLIAGMAILDTILDVSTPIFTRAENQAHGVALLLLASGLRPHRVVGPSAELSMTPVMRVDGALNNDERVYETLIGLFRKLCSQSDAALSRDLRNGRSFTPREAVAYGLADRVQL
jgi:ATP-dependent Clp protease protease subunit